MSTKRIPIKRDLNARITLRAVELFRAMEALECTCEPTTWGDDGNWRNPPPSCASCEKWWDLHNQLWRELGAKPWEWPCIWDPDAPSSLPETHANYLSPEQIREKYPIEVARFEALCEAAGD